MRVKTRATRAQVKEILDWIGNDPFREALLIKNAPIARHTLMQMKAGSFIPGEDLMTKLLGVKEEFPNGLYLPELGGLKPAS